MNTKYKNSIMFETEVIDSENENNVHRCKKRWRNNICSTSESEAGLIDDNTTETQCNTTWTSKNFAPTIHKFSSKNLGLKKEIGRSSKMIDYFELFFYQKLVEYIMRPIITRLKRAVTTWELKKTLEEMYCFFALSLLMTRNKKLTLHEYWSTDKFLNSNGRKVSATRRQGSPADNPMRLIDRHFPTFCKPKNRRRRCSRY
ncbi:LOW QUALITY PROTEIN: piggyBac transposable element-derived protein 4-like isoform X1 [Vespula squamosa]|uniref:PiggyBac transposable element-derived protein 4-like isoform X1 n=1 Tax=Vespula squamosa TaxID=30214 RepID=A0ABD2BDC9_VESSQ